MKLLAKLSAAFLAVSLLMVIVAYFSINSTDRVNSAFDTVGEETIPVIESLKDIKFASLKIVSSTDDYVFVSESVTGKAASLETNGLLENGLKSYNDALRRYKLLVNTYFPDEIENVELIEKKGQNVIKLSYEMIELKNQGASIVEINQKHEELKKAESDLIIVIDTELSHEKVEFNERSENVRFTIKNTQDLILSFSIITLFASVAIGFYISYNFSRPIVQLKDAAIEVGKGKLDTRVKINSDDEVGILSGAFNEMVQSLENDIEQHKRYELEIEKLSYQNELILDNAGEGIFGVDLHGDISLINRAALTLTGYERNELLGKPSHEILHHSRADGKYFSREECPIYSAYKDGIIHQIKEDLFWKKDGTSFPVDYISTPIMEQGKLAGAVVVFKDITESKKIEKMSLENKGLIQASKTKSEFLMIMSHELRTPLNAIIGFSSLLRLKKYGELNETQEKYIDNINESGNNLLMTINDILDLSRLEAGKIEILIDKICLSEVINESIITMKEKATRHKIQMKMDIDPGSDIIEADRNRIIQVLFNLLDNAIKFSKPDGGIVTITTKKEGDMAQVTVQDTGIGIKEEEVVKLFKEFEQIDKGASRHYGGTGLGLVISKKLIELHGGHIWVKSKYGEGTTFTFTLPIKAKGIISAL
jgi:PAS domain S-box-containing protein